MSDTKKFKHHLICMKCKQQSTGKTVKECEKTFGNCGISGGPLDDACKTTLYRDGKSVYTLIPTDEFEKIQAAKEAKKSPKKTSSKESKTEPAEVTPPEVIVTDNMNGGTVINDVSATVTEQDKDVVKVDEQKQEKPTKGPLGFAKSVLKRKNSKDSKN